MDRASKFVCHLEAFPGENPEFCLYDVCCGIYKQQSILLTLALWILLLVLVVSPLTYYMLIYAYQKSVKNGETKHNTPQEAKKVPKNPKTSKPMQNHKEKAKIKDDNSLNDNSSKNSSAESTTSEADETSSPQKKPENNQPNRSDEPSKKMSKEDQLRDKAPHERHIEDKPPPESQKQMPENPNENDRPQESQDKLPKEFNEIFISPDVNAPDKIHNLKEDGHPKEETGADKHGSDDSDDLFEMKNIPQKRGSPKSSDVKKRESLMSKLHFGKEKKSPKDLEKDSKRLK